MTGRILVTGSREWTNYATVLRALSASWRFTQALDVVVVQGGAPGADEMAARAAKYIGLAVETHLANWEELGKKAGPVRNAAMVALGADVCLAFFKKGAGNRGTTHCSDLAEEAGIPVWRFWE